MSYYNLSFSGRNSIHSGQISRSIQPTSSQSQDVVIKASELEFATHEDLVSLNVKVYLDLYEEHKKIVIQNEQANKNFEMLAKGLSFQYQSGETRALNSAAGTITNPISVLNHPSPAFSLAHQDYPYIRFWTREQWDSYDNKGNSGALVIETSKVGGKGPARLAKGENVQYQFLENEHGVLPGKTAAVIRSFIRTLFRDTFNTSPKLLDFSWGLCSLAYRNQVLATLYEKYPYIQLCQDDWKGNYICSRMYSQFKSATADFASTIGKQQPSTSIKTELFPPLSTLDSLSVSTTTVSLDSAPSPLPSTSVIQPVPKRKSTHDPQVESDQERGKRLRNSSNEELQVTSTSPVASMSMSIASAPRKKTARKQPPISARGSRSVVTIVPTFQQPAISPIPLSYTTPAPSAPLIPVPLPSPNSRSQTPNPTLASTGSVNQPVNINHDDDDYSSSITSSSRGLIPPPSNLSIALRVKRRPLPSNWYNREPSPTPSPSVPSSPTPNHPPPLQVESLPAARLQIVQNPVSPHHTRKEPTQPENLQDENIIPVLDKDTDAKAVSQAISLNALAAANPLTVAFGPSQGPSRIQVLSNQTNKPSSAAKVSKSSAGKTAKGKKSEPGEKFTALIQSNNLAGIVFEKGMKKPNDSFSAKNLAYIDYLQRTRTPISSQAFDVQYRHLNAKHWENESVKRKAEALNPSTSENPAED